VQPILNEIHRYDKRAVLGIYGSSIQGFRSRKKRGKSLWFDESSDYDLAICSPKLFARVKKHHPQCLRDVFDTRTIPRNINDEVFNGIYESIHFPLRANVIVYSSLEAFINIILVPLIIEVDTEGLFSGTYLFGIDIIANKQIGEKKKLLRKHGYYQRLDPDDIKVHVGNVNVGTSNDKKGKASLVINSRT
jgi:hypothetical protein